MPTYTIRSYDELQEQARELAHYTAYAYHWAWWQLAEAADSAAVYEEMADDLRSLMKNLDGETAQNPPYEVEHYTELRNEELDKCVQLVSDIARYARELGIEFPQDDIEAQACVMVLADPKSRSKRDMILKAANERMEEWAVWKVDQKPLTYAAIEEAWPYLQKAEEILKG